jgi:hypothetical protein
MAERRARGGGGGAYRTATQREGAGGGSTMQIRRWTGTPGAWGLENVIRGSGVGAVVRSDLAGRV